ncbi:hypothetical protein [Deinococcus sp. QL22]|uniref:hypothetical protein n=1 Tax=Deinococcus sp. QL22 TaxID=2939437 RepID=UPI0020172E25|nr:hypothetical protein [Deinococcus sp. QL22]UQN10215.1 hypothetical protein M1R55_27960 [Deinococcus sp. QL22]
MSAPEPKASPDSVSCIQMALAVMTQEQAKLPPGERKFPTSEILRRAAQLDSRRPDSKPFARAILTQNPEVRRLVAEARGEDLSLELTPDFSTFASWRPPRSFSAQAQARRRREYTAKARKSLAELVVGLEELEQYFQRRRQLFSAIGWNDGPWPADHSYPADPFQPSPNAVIRYVKYWGRTRRAMALQAVRLEKTLAEHMAHLNQIDSIYYKQRKMTR